MSPTALLPITEKERFQLLYYTQVYQTLFAFFARFEVSNAGDEHVKIDAIEFIGVSYKGPKCVRIVGIEVSYNKTGVPDIDALAGGFLEFKLTISATGSGTFSRLPEGHPHVSNGDPKRIMRFSKGIIVPKKSTFRLERTLQSMSNFEEKVKNGGQLNLPADAYHHGSFDSEFFARDGFMIRSFDSEGEPHVEYDPGTHIQDHENGGMRSFKNSSGASIDCPIGIGFIHSI